MTPQRTAGTGWMLFLFMISGNPAVYALTGGADNLLPIAAAILWLAVLARRVQVLTPRFLRVTALLVVISIVQCFEFHFWPVVTILGMVTRLFIAAAIVPLVDDFPRAYVRAITIIATYCIVMWTIDQMALALSVDFRSLFKPLEDAIGLNVDHRFAGVYTFAVLDGKYRNCGIFREPGLFAGYLLLGLMFLLLDRDRGEPLVRRRRIIIMLVGLLTTVSTAGYVTLPLVLASVALDDNGRTGRASQRAGIFLAVLLVSIAGLWVVGTQTSFLQNKVEAQYEEFVNEGKGYEITRFGAALLDLNAIEERPLAGWGFHESTKFAQTPELAEISPSGGLTGWARSVGLLGVAVLLVAMWASMRPLVGGNLAASIYTTAVIAVIIQPNTFLNFPMFLSLMFLRPPRPPRDLDGPHDGARPPDPAPPRAELRSRPS